MPAWNRTELDRLKSCLNRARAGEPSLLLIEGGAGVGKTALLEELVAAAGDFQVLRADGLEGDQLPFTLLAQWGVDPPRPAGGGEPSPRLGAQALQDRLDVLALRGPVLLVADDLHWADPESVEALLWLLRRTSGDQMLVAVGTRPLPAEAFAGWQRWVSSRGVADRIVLTGLTPAQVAEVARVRWPQLTDEIAQRLYEHTDGNPLYITTLLAENELAELSTAGMLPAPAMFARSIAGRTGRLDPDALTLLRAACVLGSGWNPLALIVAVAGIEEPATRAQELDEARLVDVRRVDGPMQLRPSHALIRASVHQQTPLSQLRSFHSQAATLVATRAAALQHRMAAAEQYDSGLAEELEAYAGDLYARRSFRQAAQYLRWASALTPGPAQRERRWLESLYDQVLSFDFSTFEASVDDVRAADDRLWRALVLGQYAIQQRRYRDAVEALEPIASSPVGSTLSRARYRVEVLLAWARLCLGHPSELVADAIVRAESVHVDDAGLNGLHLVAASQISIRQHGIGPVLTQLSALPTADAVPLPATGALAFRGILRVTMGLTREATDDLREATRRIVDGVTDLGAGSFHALLGLAQWLEGEWGRARVSFRQAFDIGGPVAHQMTAAVAPLADIGLGRFAEADVSIARARALLVESPWYEACQLFLGTLLVRAHAGGSTSDQARVLDSLRGTPFVVTDVANASPTMLLNYVPALIWAGRLDEADAGTARLMQIHPTAPWASAVSCWYRGLSCEARGDRSGALTHVLAALDADLDLPLYRAHLLACHARLAGSLGRPGADDSLSQAEAIYARLGASPYLQPARALRSAPAETAKPAETLPGGAELTEREQDVLTLLMAGMSYAQISRELFITQSTVGYHLGNIYGKAGVNSRHQLSALARSKPHLFGISATPD